MKVMMHDSQADPKSWPELTWSEWQPTAETVHMWTQIVGKTRLALSPLQAHWWNVPLYVSARGLSTSAMPYGRELLEIEFDFVSHDLRFRISSGARLSIPLRAQSVAEFFAEYQRSLAALGVSVHIHPTPVEVKSPIPFAEDREHASYDPEYVHRFWRVLVQVDEVFQQFSSQIHRQDQSRPFLLGKLRSCGYTLFRTPGAGSRRRRPNHQRSLFS